MASISTLPQASRPVTNPPAGPIPPLPNHKPRKTVSSDTPRAASPYQASKLRTPSSPKPSLKSPLSTSNSTSNLNTARSASNGRTPNSPDKSLRRTISIASFPQPPKANSRPSTASSISGIQGVSSSMRPQRGSRLSTGTTSSYRSSKTQSLLSGGGEAQFISSADAEASPTHSRSSSAQGSCSTSATTFEDAEDPTGKLNSKPKEIKGNVLVSVRVRPDNNSGGETPRNHGEWSVDSRKSLISYRGKEGGDYFYGKQEQN